MTKRHLEEDARRRPSRASSDGAAPSDPISEAGAAEATPHFDFAFQGRQKRIAETAYFKAERRGFVPGHELDDWLEAEQEVDEATTPLPSY